MFTTHCTKLLPCLVCFTKITLWYWDAILKPEKRILKYISAVFKFIFTVLRKSQNAISSLYCFCSKCVYYCYYFRTFWYIIQEMYEETIKTTVKLAQKISMFFPRIVLHVHHNFYIFSNYFFFSNSFISNVPVLWLLC